MYKRALEKLVPIEAKAAMTFDRNFFKNIRYFQKLVQDRCQDSYLIYAGQQEQSLDSIQLVNYMHATRSLGS